MKILVCVGKEGPPKEEIYETLDRIVFMARADHDYFPLEVLYRELLDQTNSSVGEWIADRGYIGRPAQIDRASHGDLAIAIKDAQLLRQNPDLVVVFGEGEEVRELTRRAIRDDFIVILGG